MTCSPIGVVTEKPDALPSDVYDTHENYPLERFTLTDKAAKDLEALRALEVELYGSIHFRAFRFDRDVLEQARALNAAHSSPQSHDTIVVGQDITDQIVCDHIAAQLKELRATKRR